MNMLDKVKAILDEFQAINLIDLPIGHLTTMADVLIICEGRSPKHMQTMAEKLIEDPELKAIYRPNTSSLHDPDWIVVDYGSVIIHLMSEEARQRYELEKLWSHP